MDALLKLAVLTLTFAFFLFKISTGVDVIGINQSITDRETITSAGGSFELGFFSPADSKLQYLGVWYKKVSDRTVVWVANRETPLTGSSGVLKLTPEGILVVVNATNDIMWSSNSSCCARDPNAQLLETGNLVIKDGSDSDEENFLWQSFDYPGDTLLPDMKLGCNRQTGLDRYLSSWKSADDPSRGQFTYGINLSGSPQLFVRNGSAVTFRSGPWNGLRFSGYTHFTPNSVYTYDFVVNDKEIYFIYHLINKSLLSRLVLTPEGLVRRFVWINDEHKWIQYSTVQKDDCDHFALCGANGICKINQSPICECMKGFRPKIQSKWDMGDWRNGCIRSTPLDCQKDDGFVTFSGVKVPDTRTSWFNASMNLKECASLCLRNCSCTAYVNSNISRTGSGCLLWFDDLIDTRELAENGQEFYVRLSASDSAAFSGSNSSSKKQKQVLAICMSITGTIFLTLAITLYVLKKKKQQLNTEEQNSDRGETNAGQEDLVLSSFHFNTILNATNNFSCDNKIGEGGFGPVYKGILQDGQEIAVKRLSKTSSQGLKEFKNEVESIAKLQHRNLVKLLGCCINRRERMLIYEYLPNKSLDLFIFDEVKGAILDWHKRFMIINGIARGLLYLHQDSRLRIIHRDLKAENVLLDNDMNPKISDFGIARIFGGTETEASTKRVAGTLGYMSPEYASEGLYSTKSDVFSFGVLVLEIISGKRNRGFSHPDHDLNLLGHAWTLYIEGRSLEFIDASLQNTCYLSEVLRSISVGLLCVQRFPDDRPSMHSVVLMLGGEGASVLPRPKEPCFFTDRTTTEASSSTGSRSVITQLEAR